MDEVLKQDGWGALAIAGSFLALLTLAEFWRYWKNPPVEWTRKLVHIGGGIIALVLPVFVSSHWTVLVLSASMGLLFVATKAFGWLPSVHAVERKSRGAEYYPLVIYLLFLLAASEPWKYVVAVLNLAVADAFAAIIGKRFGRLRFEVADQHKSLEGCLAFFIASFCVTFSPMLWCDPLADSPSRMTHYFLAATLIGLLATCFEAVSQRGQDNLWIPLGVLLVLTKTFQTDVSDLWIQNVSFLAILVVVSVVTGFSRTFNLAGALIFCLASYGCWAMGSFDWAMPIFVGFFVYVAVTRWFKPPWHLQIRAVTASVFVPFVFLAAANIAIQYEEFGWYRFFYGPFLAAAAVSLTQAVVNVAIFQAHQKALGRLKSFLFALVSGVLIGTLFVILTVARSSLPNGWTGLMLIATVTLVASSGFYLNQPANPETGTTGWLCRRMGLNLIAGLAIAALQWWRWASSWNPS
jgi:dolichol kinase